MLEREQDSYLAGVDEDHASFDSDLVATRIAMLLKKQALAKAERRDVELNTRRGLREENVTGVAEFKCHAMRAREAEINQGLVKSLSKLRVERMRANFKWLRTNWQSVSRHLVVAVLRSGWSCHVRDRRS
jgi:hypothetical protein